MAIDPRGVSGPTAAQARGPAWTRVTRGLYLPRGLAPERAVDQRIVTAAALLPVGAAVTGWAALRWQGVRYLDGYRGRRLLPVTLAVPPGAIRARPGIAVTEAAYLRAEPMEHHGLTVSSIGAATAYEVIHAQTLEEAVAVIDRVCAADLLSLTELRELGEAWPGVRGRGRLRAALELAVENCWSPMETLMRLYWREIGIVHVVCNHPVFALDGTFLGTPDVLDLETGTVGEYDGSVHLVGTQRAKDIRREGLFRRAGLEYVEMVAGDLGDRSDFQRRTLDARRRARAAGGPRLWTNTPPPGWVSTHTVELRRSLDPWQRRRFLGWQAG